MGKFQKCFTLLVAIVMLFSVLPRNIIYVSAATSTYTEYVSDYQINYSYSISNNQVTITHVEVYSATRGYDVTWIELTIPDKIGGLPVTEIGAKSFNGNMNYNSFGRITIPYGVKIIGEAAFANCLISRVDIPDSVTTIGKAAFAETKLREVIIPASVTSIGDYAFNTTYNDNYLATAYFKHSDANIISHFGTEVFAKEAPGAGYGISFEIIYPYNAKGFTTPMWKGYPTRPDGETQTSTQNQASTQNQTFPPSIMKSLEVVGGYPSTVTTDTTLKFVATADTSVTKVLFSDNYFFDNRKDLETVTSSNGVFQTTQSYTFSEGSHKIYCFPIDAYGNIVWDNGVGIDDTSRSYGAALNVVKSTGSQGGFQGEAISVGAKFRWSTTYGVIGYRVYRSESASDEGISITDFYITSNEFVDVNVKPNKTYYYTVRGVIAEARPFEGIPEQLTSPSERITVKTPSTIVGDELVPPSPNAVKKFILMTLDDPYMVINGTRKEIDPGRGTTPLLLNSRTMVPIRAIVEGMGGSVDWNGAISEITMKYTPNTVKMTLNKEQFTVNGIVKVADVPPITINDRTMLPIRFVAESLGCAIDWLNSTRQVVIVYY